MTGVYPLGLPPPEDTAAMAMPQIEQNMQMQQGGGGVPPEMQLAEMGAGGAF
jgi:hypothetical protein